MRSPFRLIDLVSPDATADFAALLAPELTPGDVLLLDGPIGSGKTHFARSLIQARLSADGAPVEDVPSPTFTLIQTYDSGVAQLWHADLYRLTHPDEIEELGLVEAFDAAICLVEWPDRLAALSPSGALTLSFEQGATEAARRVMLGGPDPWPGRIEAMLGPARNV